MGWAKGVVLAVAGIADAFTLVAQGKTIYVDDDANSPGDGTRWATAYKYLQDGLADARVSGESVEIRVAQGVYWPDRSAAEPNGTGDREMSFDLIGNVILAGGFAGMETNDPNVRNPGLYETVLSGDLLGNDIDPCGVGDLVEDPSRDDNTLSVLRALGEGSQCELDGMTVSGAGREGGLYCDGQETMRVRQCIFRHNRALSGGGISSRDSRLWVSDCVFEENTTSGDGGAVYSHSSDVVVETSVFRRNSAGWGGAINCAWSTLDMCDCLLEYNDSVGYESNHGRGGAVCLVAQNDAVIHNCIMCGNKSQREGGAIATVILVGGTTAPHLNMQNCTLAGNRAGDIGGAVTADGWGTLKNCLVAGNRSRRAAGIVLRWGGAVENCTLADNVAEETEGGLSLTDGWVTNCILWGNAPDQIISYGATDVKWSNVQGGWPGIENIDIDPCFAAHGYWDTSGSPQDANDDSWIAGDYHLQSQAGRWVQNEGQWVKDEVTSPCIDRSDPMSLLGLEPFPNGGKVNMGAYGGTDEASKSYFGEPVCQMIMAGDINGDCRVDFTDVAMMAGYWTSGLEEYLRASNPYPADGLSDILLLYGSMYVMWKPGPTAVSYDLYHGNSYESVRDANRQSAEYKGNLRVPKQLLWFYAPMEYLVRYWRVDVVTAESTLIKGVVWSFGLSPDNNWPQGR